MTQLVWNEPDEKLYELGVEKGVLFVRDAAADYPVGEAWTGLISVAETPGGAETTDLYASNEKYTSLISMETFGGTIEAYRYPEGWASCDGTKSVMPGVMMSQQPRSTFGLAYLTKIGSDAVGQDLGYKLHLVYGALAKPSERTFATIGESPEAITFSYEFTTTPVNVVGSKPTALIVIDSTIATTAQWDAITDVVFGTVADDARLPLPDEVFTLIAAAI